MTTPSKPLRCYITVSRRGDAKSSSRPRSSGRRSSATRRMFTPDFDSIQGAQWMFHCSGPMRFLGRWGKSDFDQHAPDGDGASYAHQIADMDEHFFDALTQVVSPDDGPWVWAYGFRCVTCGDVAANWDLE